MLTSKFLNGNLIFIFLNIAVFGRWFVKGFALCYWTVVCLSLLSVCNVGVL